MCIWPVKMPTEPLPLRVTSQKGKKTGERQTHRERDTWEGRMRGERENEGSLEVRSTVHTNIPHCAKSTIHQVTTMLATSKMSYFQVITTCYDPTLWLSLEVHSTVHTNVPCCVTTILATSKNILLPGHNHLLTTGTDYLTLWLLPERQQVVMIWK